MVIGSENPAIQMAAKQPAYTEFVYAKWYETGDLEQMIGYAAILGLGYYMVKKKWKCWEHVKNSYTHGAIFTLAIIDVFIS